MFAGCDDEDRKSEKIGEKKSVTGMDMVGHPKVVSK